MRRTAVEEEAPMLEMTPVVAPGEDAKDEEAGEPGDARNPTPTPDEGLAGEFAVGAGVPRTWDDPHEGCPDDCGPDGPCVKYGRRNVARFCKCLGARRLGYMAVLRWKNVKGKPAPMPGGAVRRTKLLCIVGPFWPFTCCVTFPAHLSDQRRDWDRRAAGPSSGDQNSLGFISVVSGHGVIVCGLPGSRDLRRHPEKPEANWRWNDQARTFRPPGACYDEDLGLVVEGFDHVHRLVDGHGHRSEEHGRLHQPVSSRLAAVCVCIVLDVLIVMRVLPPRAAATVPSRARRSRHRHRFGAARAPSYRRGAVGWAASTSPSRGAERTP